jgi:hypothetical protein
LQIQLHLSYAPSGARQAIFWVVMASQAEPSTASATPSPRSTATPPSISSATAAFD